MDPAPEDLAAARAGDARGFERLVAPYRRELEAHLYRMTGSLPDAEDLLQESLLRAWRALDRFEGRSSLRTWLYRIATNACLSALERRPARSLPSELGPPGLPLAPPPPEALWLDPAPDDLWAPAPPGPEARYSARESVAVAFLAALQALPPLQRAVVVLREVLGFPAAEVAELLETSPAAVNSALQRARATLEARREALEAAPALDPEDARTQALLRRYVEAWESGDTDALVALLREDATLTMPPVPTWFRGREAIVAFLRSLSMGALRLRPVAAAGGPALAAWVRPPGQATYRPHAIHVLGGGPDGLARLDVFMNPAIFQRFGLPLEP